MGKLILKEKIIIKYLNICQNNQNNFMLLLMLPSPNLAMNNHINYCTIPLQKQFIKYVLKKWQFLTHGVFFCFLTNRMSMGTMKYHLNTTN